MSNVRFWASISVLIALISLAFPWWGIDKNTVVASPSWSLFWGFPNLNSLPRVGFFSDLLDKSLAANYTLTHRSWW